VKALLIAALAATLAPVWGQQLDLKFDSIAAKAKEKTEIDLDNNALTALAKVGAAKGLDGILANITGVAVRSYEFAREGEYNDRDLEALRKQVSGGNGWSRIVNVKEEKEATEIYMLTAAGKPGGFLVISAGPQELTVVSVQGTIQLAQLQELVQSNIAFDLKSLHTPGKGQ
jgi:hypothetical protein